MSRQTSKSMCRRITELQGEREFEFLRDIMEKVKEGHLISYIQQAVPVSEGEYNLLDIQESEAYKCSPIFNINNGYFYVTVPKVSRDAVNKVQAMWATILRRGTQNYVAGKANDYILTVDLANYDEEENMTYCISCRIPVFASTETGKDTLLVFELQNVVLIKEEVSSEELDYEIFLDEEYEAETRGEDGGIDEDPDDFIEDPEILDYAEDVISTEEYEHL